MENKDPRAGHRKRLRDRYIQTGFDGFAPHEVLELVLQAAIPRQDTKKIAYELIDRFGNINNVFSASIGCILLWIRCAIATGRKPKTLKLCALPPILVSMRLIFFRICQTKLFMQLLLIRLAI